MIDFSLQELFDDVFELAICFIIYFICVSFYFSLEFVEELVTHLPALCRVLEGEAYTCDDLEVTWVFVHLICKFCVNELPELLLDTVLGRILNKTKALREQYAVSVLYQVLLVDYFVLEVFPDWRLCR